MKRVNPLVSIIVPVYNAAENLPRMLKSILLQHYVVIELLFIDDCSNDDSLLVLRKYTDELEGKGFVVNIIKHEVNKGVAVARNTGLDHATGEFIYYVDADDEIEPDAIELMVQTAKENNVDIVGCNWFLTFAKNERKMNQPKFVSGWDAVDKILCGTMRWNLWLFMAKRSLYEDNSIRFLPDMNMGEDLMVTVKLFTYADSVAYVDKALYHYVQTDQSLTKQHLSKYSEEVTMNVGEIEHFLLSSAFSNRLGDRIAFLKLNIKLPLLISDKKEKYKEWLIWFPESNSKIMKNKSLPLRIRLIQWFAMKKCFWALQLYHTVVIRFVYGRLYR